MLLIQKQTTTIRLEEYQALLRVTRAAEKVGAIPLQTRHQDDSDRAVIKLREALKALPKRLKEGE